MLQCCELKIGTESYLHHYDENDSEALEGLREMKEIAKKKAKEAWQAILSKWNELKKKLLERSKEIKTTGYTGDLMIPKAKYSKFQEFMKEVKKFFDLSKAGSKIMFAANQSADTLYDLAYKLAESKTNVAALMSVLNNPDQSAKNKVAAGAVLVAGSIKDSYITFPVSTLLTWLGDMIKCVTDFDSLVDRFKNQMGEVEKALNMQSAMQGSEDEATKEANKKISKITVILTYACNIVIAIISLFQLGKIIKKVASSAKKATQQKFAKESMSELYIDDTCDKYMALESIVNQNPYFEATEAFKIDAKVLIQKMRDKLTYVKSKIKDFFYKLRDYIRGTQVMKETAYAIPGDLMKRIETAVSDVNDYVKNGSTYIATESFIGEPALESTQKSPEEIEKELKEINDMIKNVQRKNSEAEQKLDNFYNKAIETMKNMQSSQSKVEKMVSEAEADITIVEQSINGGDGTSKKASAMKKLSKVMKIIGICALLVAIILGLAKFKVSKSAEN